MSGVLAVSTQTTVAVGGALLLVGSLVLVTTRRFGVALALYVVYLGGIDGYLKLAVGGGAATAGRTILLLTIVGASLLALLVERRPFRMPPYSALVGGLVVIALVQIANPGNPNLVKPIGALRQEIEFVPLFFLAYATVRREADLQTFLLLLVALAVANGVASLIQYNLTPEQFADWGPGYRDRILGTGATEGRLFADAAGEGRARPFGLGADAGAGGIVGLFGAVAAVGLILRPRAAGFGSATLVRGVAIAATPGVVLAVVLSQTRAVIVASVVALLVQALLTARRQFLPLILCGGVALAVSALVIGQLTSDPSNQGLSRYGDITPGQLLNTTREERGSSLTLVTTYAVQFPFGAGLGGVGPATGFRGTVRPEQKLNGETQFNVLILDLGIPGLLLVLSFVVVVVRRVRRITTVPEPAVQAQLAALGAAFVGVTTLFVSGAPLTGAPGAPMFWAVGGVLVYWLAQARAPLTGAPEAPRAALTAVKT